MKEEIQMLVKVRCELAKKFKKKLIDDGLTYKAWLEKQIHTYISVAEEK
jgi:hypothetical protein